MLDKVHKHRRIVLRKDWIYKQVDSITQKLSDVALAGSEEIVKDGYASDVEDRLDGTLMSTFADSRDSILRIKLAHCLDKTETIVVDNTPDVLATYEYDFVLPEDFNGSLMKPLAQMMNDYIVKGILYDWYNQIGSDQAARLASEVFDLETRIVNTFRQPEFVARERMAHFHNYIIR